MTASIYHNPESVDAILRVVVQHIRSSAAFFVGDFLGEGHVLLPDLASPPPPSPAEMDKARDSLAEGKGYKLGLIFRLLLHAEGDWRATLFAALQSGDFITSPRIKGPIRSLQLRYAADHSIEGVDIYTDDGPIRDDEVVLILPPPPATPKIALTNFYKRHGDSASVDQAKDYLRELFPDVGVREFGRLQPDCREAAGLKRQAPRGPKKPA
jgi:hypothetical protein